MELFFAEHFDPKAQTLSVSREEGGHIYQVLRHRPGELLRLTDGKGHLIEAEISEFKKGLLRLNFQSARLVPFPEENNLEIGIAIIRPNRLSWAVEKLTELGVRKITPLLCQFNSVKHLKEQHLVNVSVSAIKQSRQFYLPEIGEPVDFKDWLQNSEHCLTLLAHPDSPPAPELRKNIRESAPLRVAIGPEGGFAPEELELARSLGIPLLHLGETILRAETAAVAAVSRIKLIRELDSEEKGS
ncbi:MAG: 16S rRNA (uracil(1498)-N(3))-methyltransferase [Calditrichia bacterium]